MPTLTEYSTSYCSLNRCDISWISGCDHCCQHTSCSSGKNFARIQNG